MEYITLLSTIVGFVGGILGIMSWVNGVKKKYRLIREQDEIWATYIGLHQAFKKNGGNVWNPDIGSDDHKIAEKMVARGWLERMQGVGYCLPERLSF